MRMLKYVDCCEELISSLSVHDDFAELNSCARLGRPIAKFNICSSNFEGKILSQGKFAETIWSSVRKVVIQLSPTNSSSDRFGTLYIPEGYEMSIHKKLFYDYEFCHKFRL